MVAATRIEFLSPVTLGTALAAVCLVAVGVYVARLLAGPSAEISRRWELLVIRGLVLVVIAVLLLNPAGVEESPGVRQRPEVFYLLDTSASMGNVSRSVFGLTSATPVNERNKPATAPPDRKSVV